MTTPENDRVTPSKGEPASVYVERKLRERVVALAAEVDRLTARIAELEAERDAAFQQGVSHADALWMAENQQLREALKAERVKYAGLVAELRRIHSDHLGTGDYRQLGMDAQDLYRSTARIAGEEPTDE